MTSGSTTGDYFEAAVEARAVSNFEGEWLEHDEVFRSPEAVVAFIRGLDPAKGPVVARVRAEGGTAVSRRSVAGVWLCDDDPPGARHLLGHANDVTDVVEWWEQAGAARALEMASSAGVPEEAIVAGALAAARATLKFLPAWRGELGALLDEADESVRGGWSTQRTRETMQRARDRLVAIFEGNPSLEKRENDGEAFAMYAIKHSFHAAANLRRDDDRAYRESLEVARLVEKCFEVNLGGEGSSSRRWIDSAKVLRAELAAAAAVRKGLPTITFLRALAGTVRRESR